MGNTNHNYLYADIAIIGLDDALTYAIPNALNHTDIGFEVEVELRNRIERGWVVNIHNTAPHIQDQKTSSSEQNSLFNEKIEQRIKVKEILSSHQAFIKEDLHFFKRIAEYYCVPITEVFENAVPKRKHKKPQYDYVLDLPIFEKKEAAILKSKHADQKLKIIYNLQNKNNLLKADEYEFYSEEAKKITQSLVKSGILKKEIHTETKVDTSAKKQAPNLTTQQQQAIEKIHASIDQHIFEPYLLFGITGSGKTEVYIRAIEYAIKTGGSALLIVPEIALTPQLYERFHTRLPYDIAILHSQIGSSNKWEEWEKIISQKKRIVIGARSAIFAPISDLRIIIVDEEHESSYKQAEGLRYHARDLAVMKAKERNCPVILGSATPSFESLAQAVKSKYKIIELTERATKANLPEIKLVDLQTLTKKEYASPNISNILKEEITKTLEKNEQVILFYNKRGFASFLQCTTCGKSVECPNCSLTFTYYQSKNKLCCHYCGEQRDAPKKCPRCTNTDTHTIDEEQIKKNFAELTPRGSGTEKIFDEISSLFPDTKIDRMDREVTGTKGSIEDILSKMQSGETQILIGTQMLAKGHDIPSVTLVGIIDADVGLHFPDFRASERTFQLIVQASGRAGRGSLPGKVIIQTREANHPTIVAAITNRFKAFARFELEFRKKLQYPPETRLARIIISSPDKMEAFEASQNLKQFLSNLTKSYPKNTPQLKTLGPTSAPIEKLRNRFRFHVLLKSPSAKMLSLVANQIKDWKNRIKGSKDLRVIIDIDPIDMM